jgi:predicted NBD/HSP70 family sugar kinase
VAEAARHSPRLARAQRGQRAPLRALNAAMQAGDPAAAAILDRYVEHLATGLAAAVNLLAPAGVVLGGTLIDAPKEVLERIREALRGKVGGMLRDAFDVRAASIRPHPGILGAATVAFDRFFYAAGPGARPPAPVRPPAATPTVTPTVTPAATPAATPG